MERLTAYTDPAAMADAVAAILADRLAAAIAERGRALFVATGGSTAPAIYDCLARAKLDWGVVRVMLSDERCVPVDHEASNARLVRERLLVGPAAAALFLPFEDAEAGEASALRLSRFMHPLSQPDPSVAPDAVLLGLGADLHVASIFPAGEGMARARSPDAPIAVATAPEPLPANAPYPRLTLSMPYLASARAILVAFTGAEKRDAWDAARPDAPICRLIAAAPERVALHWSP